MIAYLTSSQFWNRKVQIGILVIATFAAMC